MNKAVLVVDMPENCDMSDFTKMANGKIYCSVSGCGELVEDYISCRPDICPLRPMPEKKDTICYENDNWYTVEEKTKNEGWNACIDALGGKVNE